MTTKLPPGSRLRKRSNEKKEENLKSCVKEEPEKSLEETNEPKKIDIVVGKKESFGPKKKSKEEWLYEGKCFIEDKKYGEALKSFDATIQMDPKYVGNYCGKGIALLFLGRYEEAIESFNVAIRIDPKCVLAHHGKGIACCIYFANAREMVTNMLKALSAKNEWDIKSCGNSIQGDPKLELGDHYKGQKKVGLSYRIANYEEGIKHLSVAAQIDPKYANAHFYKGRSLQKLKMYEEAIKSFDAVIEIDPRCADAYFNMVFSLYQLDQIEKAIEFYKMAVELNGGSSSDYILMGYNLVPIEIINKTVNAYDTANPKALALHGIIFCAQEKYFNALISCDAALEIDPKLAFAYYYKGVALCMLDWYNKAKDTFKSILTVDSGNRYAIKAIEYAHESRKLLLHNLEGQKIYSTKPSSIDILCAKNFGETVTFFMDGGYMLKKYVETKIIGLDQNLLLENS